MKAVVYNQQGEKIGQTKLPKEIFEVALNEDLVHQVVVSQAANRRQVSAHTKTRAEVSGGGRKPWRQKGTGRARAGSIRSPIWRGGGVTFGPTKERVYKKKIPKKMQRKALMMVLSAKAKNNLILILDKITLKEAKTKLMAEIMKNLLINKETCLIALPSTQAERKRGAACEENAKRSLSVERDIIKMTNNLPKIQTIEARNLNCLDLLSSKHLIMLKESIKVIEETFIKRKTQNVKRKTTT